MRPLRTLADRAGIILMKDDAVLLMHRIKQDQDFYCIPGGHMEPGETPETTAIRELLEETTLVAHGQLTLFLELQNAGRREYYFIADSFSGTPELSGEEKGFASATNVYELVWIPLKQLPHLLLYPEELHAKLCLLRA